MASNILQFDPDNVINANIIDGMLFYSDGVTEPKKINIEKFKGNFEGVDIDHSSGTTHIYGRPFEERDISVVKDHPSILSNKFETAKIEENFGVEEEDLVPDEIVEEIVEIQAEETPEKEGGGEGEDQVVKKPSDGVAELDFEEATLDWISVKSDLKFPPTARLNDSGFLWSQTDKTLEDMIAGEGTTTNFQRVGINLRERGHAQSFLWLSKNDTTSPYHIHTNANSIVAGDFYAAPFGVINYQKTRFYGSVKKVSIPNPAASTAAPTNVISQTPEKINDEEHELILTYDKDNNNPIIESGFYISEARINDNDPAPTVQDLVDNGAKTDLGRERAPNEIVVNHSFTPNTTQYYVGYVQNKDGITYSDGLAATDQATKKHLEKTVLNPSVNTLKVKEVSATQLFLEGDFSGDKENKARIKPDMTISEAGFYFSTEETAELQDLIGKTFSGNTSTDGKVKKVSEANLDFENGGLYNLDVAPHITVDDGQTIAYVAYAIHNQGEALGKLNYFTKPAANVKPLFRIVQSEWDLKPNSTSSTGVKDILVDYQINLTQFDNSKTIDDIGIIVSQPQGEQEIKNTKNGRWDSLEEIINDTNSFTIELNKSDLIFTPNGNSTTVGKYVNTSPIEIKGLTPSEYKALTESVIKPYGERWGAVAFLVSDGVTYYSKIFHKIKGGYNPDTIGKFNKVLVGAPAVFTGDQYKDKMYTALSHGGVTLHGSLNNAGKDLQELGFYVSQTKPPAKATSTASIPTSLVDGRNPHLDDWTATATKYVSTDVTPTAANTHLNQTTNDFLDFKSVITGLTPEKQYYFVPFSNPVQTTNSVNDVSYNNSETLNNIINKTKWGSVSEFVTPKNVTTPPTPPDVRVIRHEKQLQTKTTASVSYEITAKSKDYSISKTGLYFKPANAFPNPFSDQAGNALTMANATNRLVFEQVTPDSSNIPFPGGNAESRHLDKGTGLDTVSYYAAAFAEVNTNGNLSTVISEYVLVDNSINATVEPAEIQYFKIKDPDPSLFQMNPAANIPGNTNYTAGAQVGWKKKSNAANAPSGIPEIIQYGFYFLQKVSSSQQQPSSIDNFLNEYNNLNNYGKSQQIVDDSPRMFQDGSVAEFEVKLPFFQGFPSSNIGKTYYALPFVKYQGGDFKYGDKIERLYVSDPALLSDGTKRTAKAKIDGIYWANRQAPGCYGAFSEGQFALHGSLKPICKSGGYKPGSIASFITADTDWYPFYFRQRFDLSTNRSINITGSKHATIYQDQMSDSHPLRVKRVQNYIISMAPSKHGAGRYSASDSLIVYIIPADIPKEAIFANKNMRRATELKYKLEEICLDKVGIFMTDRFPNF